MFKSLLIVPLFLLSLTSSASFYLNASCDIQFGSKAVCEVCNWQFRNVVCGVKTKGMTSRGYWYDSKAILKLTSGQCGFTYVQALNPYIDPLVDADASVKCRFN